MDDELGWKSFLCRLFNYYLDGDRFIPESAFCRWIHDMFELRNQYHHLVTKAIAILKKCKEFNGLFRSNCQENI